MCDPPPTLTSPSQKLSGIPASMGVEHSSDPSLGTGAVMSSAVLKGIVDDLMKEKVLSARMKKLNLLSSTCRSSGHVSDMRILADTFAVSNYEILLACKYPGAESFEWRTCIIEAADRPASLARDVPEVFVLYLLLASKGSASCTKIVSADLVENTTLQAPPLGAVSKRAIVRLASTVFEGAAEMYISAESSLFEEPFATTLESLISSSFQIVKGIHSSALEQRKLSLQPGEDESMRKCSLEFLNLAYRLVHIFRRQIVGNSSSTIVGCQEVSDPGNGWERMPTALRVVASSIENFTELGKLSASSGGMSLSLLNVSWKSIMALLQVDEGRETLASVVDIPPIIETLISHAVHALKRAIETLFLQNSNSGDKEIRRLFIPIKFFLHIAERISFFYPLKAIMVSRNMVSCASKVYACLLLQKDLVIHKAAAEALAELVIPTTFALVQNLLSTECVDTDQKIQLLRDITSDRDASENSQAIANSDGSLDGKDIVDELFNEKPGVFPGGLLKTGRAVLFLTVLQVSCNLNGIVISELQRKLEWILEEVSQEGLCMQMSQKTYFPIKALNMSGKWDWQLMFAWVSRGLQMYALAAAKHCSIWVEFTYFLFQNALHPCVVCGELILDIWCFVIRQGDYNLAEHHINSLLSLLQALSSSKAEVALQRRLARVLWSLIQIAPPGVTARIYRSIFCENPFGSETGAWIATLLLQEGFSFAPLKDSPSKGGWDLFISSCIAGGKGLVDSLKRRGRGSARFMSEKQALKCLLLLLSDSAYRGEEIEQKYLEDIIQIANNLISMYTHERANSVTFHALGIIGPALELIAHIQHLLDPKPLQLLLVRLLDLCPSNYEIAESKELKQALGAFLAGLSGIPIPEDEGNPAMKALWGLYHSVLREKHWVLIHSGLASFAFFAAHTSCQELWQFVPLDAAVVSDVHTEDSTEDIFMDALKRFIEKECALQSLAMSKEGLELLRIECNLQKGKSTQDRVILPDSIGPADMEIDSTSKGATEPTLGTSEIHEAFAMLYKGIGVLKERMPEWLKGTPETSQEWETLRSRLGEVNAQVDALRRLQG